MKLLTPKEAAEYLGMSEGTLAVWRTTSRYDLPYIKVGRHVKYNLEDLINFLKERTVKGQE